MNGKIRWRVAEVSDAWVAEFQIEGGVLSPEDLPQVLQSFRDLVQALPKTRGLILSGRGPIWLYSALVHEAHIFKYVATFDPRLGGGVVVATHTPQRRVGEIVPIDYPSLSFFNFNSSLLVAVIGDPNSGKSVFVQLLRDALASRGVPVITQEGDIGSPTQHWTFSELGAKLRKQLKKELWKNVKGRLQWIIASLRGLRSFPGVVLVDLGGGKPHEGVRVTEENERILRLCTHVIICSRDDNNQIAAWKRELAEKTPHLKIIATLKSIYDPHRNYDYSERDAVWHLDREAYASSTIPPATLRVVAEVAERIIKIWRGERG